jgi:hypothetical protein
LRRMLLVGGAVLKEGWRLNLWRLSRPDGVWSLIEGVNGGTNGYPRWDVSRLRGWELREPREGIRC